MVIIKSLHENDETTEKMPTTPEEKDEKVEKQVKEIEPKDVEVEEGASYIEAGYQICIENVRNWNNIMMAIGIDELTYLDREGKEKVYTESNISSFFNKIAAIIQSVWAKIKGLWRKFTTSLQSMIKNDEAFINKFSATMEDGAELAKVKMSSEDHKGYKFDKQLDFKTAESSLLGFIGKLSSTLKESVESLEEAEKESEDEYISKLRKAICPSASGAAGTFTDECLSYIRGDEVKNIFTDFTFAQIKDEILSAEKLSTENDAAYKVTEEIITKELQKIEGLKSKDNDDLNDKVTSAVKTISTANNVLSLANSVTITALKARYTQAKTVAKRWIVIGKGKNDKEPNKVAADESAITAGNLLENLGII